MRRFLVRAVLLIAVAASLCTMSGCAQYWRNRATDFSEMFDIGVTYSPETHWVFYNSFESILTVGYANYEATFYGWGGGQFGATPMYLNAWGALVYGKERIGWGDYDEDDTSTLYTQTVGLVGVPCGVIHGEDNWHYVPT
jgi:hypothetical protein